MIVFALGLFTLGLAACGSSSQNPLVIGHGGAGYSATNAYAPNSRPSIERALGDYDADGVEIDVQVAADGTLIAFHDEFLAPKTDCAGSVVNKTLRELKTCRYRHNLWDPSQDKILTLAEALQIALHVKPKAHIFLDLKSFTAEAAGMPLQIAYVAGLKTIVDWVSRDRLWIVSGSEQVLINLKQSFDQDARILADAEYGSQGLQMVDRLVLEGMVVSHEKVTPAQVRALHDEGKIVVLFNVKSYTASNEALELEPEAIQADDIPALQAALE